MPAHMHNSLLVNQDSGFTIASENQTLTLKNVGMNTIIMDPAKKAVKSK